jgi:hypothetical protein
MSLRAPLHVPAELRQDQRRRWFRLTDAVSVEGLSLAHVVPEELDGSLAVAFHLPGDGEAIRCVGRVAEEIVGHGETEHAERRAIRFDDLAEAARTRIANYVTERLGQPS